MGHHSSIHFGLHLQRSLVEKKKEKLSFEIVTRNSRHPSLPLNYLISTLEPAIITRTLINTLQVHQSPQNFKS